MSSNLRGNDTERLRELVTEIDHAVRDPKILSDPTYAFRILSSVSQYVMMGGDYGLLAMLDLSQCLSSVRSKLELLIRAAKTKSEKGEEEDVGSF